jgi:hypothetical protein
VLSVERGLIAKPGPNDRKAYNAVGLMCIVFAAVSAFAKPPAHQNSAVHHVSKDPAVQAYSHNGLPCSTAPAAGVSGQKAQTSVHRLDEIERRGMTVVHGNSQHAEVSQYRPIAIRNAPRQPAIDFAYHASNARGAMSSTRGR